MAETNIGGSRLLVAYQNICSALWKEDDAALDNKGWFVSLKNADTVNKLISKSEL